MARDYDSQLLESVAVRRRRLRDALVFGPGRTRREADENTGKILGSIALAAVLCAGCLGWSFVSDRFLGENRGRGLMSSEPAAAADHATVAAHAAPARTADPATEGGR